MKLLNRFVFALLLAASLCLPARAAGKKIVLVAGRPSHGPGEHEFNAGCMLLQKCLQDVPGLTVALYKGGWPDDPRAFDGADAVILYMDGGSGHPVIQGDHLRVMQELMDKGVGLGCYHFAVEIPKDKGGPEFLKWIGGYYEDRWSTNPHWVADFKSLPEHAITRGVKPFAIRDEWYYNIRFRPDMAGVTPILVGKPDDETRQGASSSPRGPYAHIVAAKGREEVLAWAVERPDGGRGFGFTGGHFHKSWGDQNFRKLVLNSFFWLAKMEVPAGGVVSTVTPEELQANQDPKGGSARATVRPPNAAAAKYKSGLVTSGLVSIDVDLTNAKGLWLVVTDGGDGDGCDWADWIAPELTGADGKITKLTDLKWTSATTGFGNVGVNKNVDGGPLKIAGQAFANGIGAHATSVIEYPLPAGAYTRFKARAGLDEGGTKQGCGSSVEFLVFTDKPGRRITSPSTKSGPVHPNGPEAAEASMKSMTAAPGLAATLFASEPMLVNPADMDIDAYGRVWVTEGANYRAWASPPNGPVRPEGDRIVILEDTKGTGKADKATTFYQGLDINTALGICVLGNRVIVSCAPNVFIFTDNGPGQAPTKELLFTGISGVQHDHAIHAFTFGPDGKLYFNFGNAGKHLRDKNGQPVVDVDGNKVEDTGHPYREGMVFRCNLDGSELEVLAQNFRNNYEVCVDSFGTLWQSDNDDDGNRGVRINYVMEHGNFGYVDEMTGASWQTKRTNLEKDIPHRHWHQNDPGVVPNLLLTGAGSPTGILIYEGNLLPEVFQNQIIHCDAGPRVVRSYPVMPDGAGYSARIENILTSSDTWYRPSDVCVAPDGSLYVSDWNDAGVGGHYMADQKLATMSGRVYRVAPEGSRASVPSLDLDSIEGCVAALESPNQARRYLGWTRLHDKQGAAENALLKVWEGGNPRMRARALQLLARIKGRETRYVGLAVKDSNPDIRITGLRIARELKLDVISYVEALAHDPSAQVRRECAIALRHNTSSEAPKLWADLARQHDGVDRWYLEALGIGADKQESLFFSAWLASVGGNWDTAPGRDIIWRSRGTNVPAYLVKIITNPATTEEARQRYIRALDFIKGPEKEAALIDLLGVPSK